MHDKKENKNENVCKRNFDRKFSEESCWVEGAHELFQMVIQQFASEGCPIFLPKFGSDFSRTKSFCFENCILLAFGLAICEGVGEDSGYGIGHVDIQVGSCICLSVFVLP